MTAGFKTSDPYSNAIIDNWLMSLSGSIGIRWVGARCAWDSTDSIVDVTNIMGGLSAFVNRTSTGLYDLTWEMPFKVVPSTVVVCGENNHASIYEEATKSGCKVMTEEMAGPSLSDEIFYIIAIGR